MSSEISSIGRAAVSRLTATPSTESVAKAAESTGDSFGSVVGEAINSLQSLQNQADSAAVSYATGGDVELHDLMIATEKLNLGFQLTMQVRNKVLEAYQEIMRMQV